MDLVKSQFDRIQAQLVALTPSQKMLTASLVIILVMSLFYWTKYAGSPELAPVLDQAMTSQEAGSITDYLRAKGFDVHVVGDRVMVPADRREEAIAALSFESKLPQNIESGFDVMLKQMNPFDSASKTDVMWNEAKQITLSNMMRSWPGVQWATVVVDNTTRRSFIAEESIKPSASVNIKMKDGQRGDKKLAQAAVRLVAGSIAGMDPARVTVIVNGVPTNTGEGESGAAAADTLFDLQKAKEKYYEGQIEHMFEFMGARVFARVPVEVATRTVATEKTTPDLKNSIYKPLKENSITDEMNTSQGGAPEPGAASNTQANGTASVDGAAGGGAGANPGERSTSTKTEERNEYTLIPAQTIEKSSEGPGRVTVQSAAVRLPRSYFVSRYKQETGKEGKDVDRAALTAFIEQEIVPFRNEVRLAVGGLDDKLVTVGLYDDLPTERSVMPAGVAEAPAGLVSVATVGSHAKEIAVGALAVVSLFMVSMMVRKSTPAPVIAAKIERPAPQTLEAGEVLAGEATEGNPLLDGMELDDDAVKTQQMIGQVSQMVKENPDVAANLVKRWLNRS